MQAEEDTVYSWGWQDEGKELPSTLLTISALFWAFYDTQTRNYIILIHFWSFWYIL